MDELNDKKGRRIFKFNLPLLAPSIILIRFIPSQLVFDGFAGADESHRLPIRIVNEYAWHNLFVHQLFIRLTAEELKTHKPEITVIALPGLKAGPTIDGTNSKAFIIISFKKRLF